MRSSGGLRAPAMLACLAVTTALAGASGLAISTAGCGSATAIFNPAFINPFFGGVVPVTPGPGAAFVFVRTVNDIGQPVEFIVTIERDVLVVDDQGNFRIDQDGQFITRSERETVRLTTLSDGQARELGTLFPCGESPVTQVGLGENLLPGDAAVFVGGQGAGGAAGFGVPAGNLNPLLLQEGNFNCGDTIIFRAFQSRNVAGGVGLQSFVLPGSEQPSVFQGPDTFANYERFVEAQVREDEP